jgi:hypothetical protein
MKRNTVLGWIVVVVLLAFIHQAPAKGGVVALNGGLERSLEEVVLFPYDNYSIPLIYGLELGLIPGEKHKENPIIRMGKPGKPDSKAVAYYGTVIKVGDQLRMWYIGAPEVYDTRAGGWPGWGLGRVCYAVSKDGIQWEKPALGLVEFEGSKQNNLVDLDIDRLRASLVLYEPDDPDPNRRFKMVFESDRYGAKFGVAYSPDGLKWKQSPKNPVGPVFEMAGMVKLNGAYYVNGQGLGYPKRILVTHVSYDFENWTQSGVVGFRRDNIPPRLPVFFRRAGEQVHLGASIWDRGNVLLGFYGQWHGADNDDRRYISMDIGLVVTQDGLHYREPIPDFRIISAAEEPDGAHPSLIQGQGFENLGDRTLIWYGGWMSGEVRVATWERDRLGYFEPVRRRKSEGPFKASHFITCPIRLEDKGGKVYLNADGLSEDSYLKVELLDEQLRGVAGYSGADSALVKQSGLRQPVQWGKKKSLQKFPHALRVRITYGGLRPEDARVYAVYVTQK